MKKKSEYNLFLKSISVIVAGIFLFNQVAWCADDLLEVISSKQIENISGLVISETQSSSTILEALMSQKQTIEDFNILNSEQDPYSPQNTEFCITTEIGDIVSYDNGSLKNIKRSDGTIIKNIILDPEGGLLDADITYADKKEISILEGKLISILDEDGTKFTYNDEGLVEHIEYTDGKSRVYAYEKNDNNEIVQIKVKEADKFLYYGSNDDLQRVEYFNGRTIEYENGNVLRIERGDGTEYHIKEGKVISIVFADGSVLEEFSLDEEGALLNAIIIRPGSAAERIKYSKDTAGGKVIIETADRKYIYNEYWDLIKCYRGDNVYDYIYAEDREHIKTVLTQLDGTIKELDAKGRLRSYSNLEGTYDRYDYDLTQEGALKVIKREIYDGYRVYQRYYGSENIDREETPYLKTIYNLDANDDKEAFAANGASYYKRGEKYIDISISLNDDLSTIKYCNYNYVTDVYDQKSEKIDIAIKSGADYVTEYIWTDENVGIYIYEASLERPDVATFVIEDNEWDPKFFSSGNNAEVKVDEASSGTYMANKSVCGSFQDTLHGSAIYEAEFYLDSVAQNKVFYSRLTGGTKEISYALSFSYDNGTSSVELYSYDNDGKAEIRDIPFEMNIEEDTPYVMEMINEDDTVTVYLYEKGKERTSPIYAFENIHMQPQIYTGVSGGDVIVNAWDNLEYYEYGKVTGDVLKCGRNDGDETIIYEHDPSGGLLYKIITLPEGTIKVYNSDDRLIKEERLGGEITLYEYGEEGNVDSIYPNFPEGTVLSFYESGLFEERIEKAVFPDGDIAHYAYEITDEDNLRIYKRRLYDATNLYQGFYGTTFIEPASNPSLETTFLLDPDKTYASFYAGAEYYNGGDKNVGVSLSISDKNPYLAYYNYDQSTGESEYDSRYLDITIDKGKEYKLEYIWKDQDVEIYLYKTVDARPDEPIYVIHDAEWDPKFSVSGSNANVALSEPAITSFRDIQSISTDYACPLKKDPIYRTEFNFDNNNTAKNLYYTIGNTSNTKYESLYTRYYGGKMEMVYDTYDYTTGKNTSEKKPLDIELAPGKSYIIECVLENNEIRIYCYEKGLSPGEPIYVLEDANWAPRVYANIYGGNIKTEVYDNLEVYEYNTKAGLLLDNDIPAEMRTQDFVISSDNADLLPKNSDDPDLLKYSDISSDISSDLTGTYTVLEKAKTIPIVLNIPGPSESIEVSDIKNNIKDTLEKIGTVKITPDNIYIHEKPDGSLRSYQYLGESYILNTSLDSNGLFTSYTYTENGEYTGKIRVYANGEIYKYGPQDKLIKNYVPNTGSEINKYYHYDDFENHLSFEQDVVDTWFEGASYTYSDSGRLHLKTLSDGTVYEYSDTEEGTLLKETDPGGKYKIFENYYAGTSQARHIKEYSAGNVPEATYEYDAGGILLNKTDHLQGTTYTYHNNGEKRSVRDPYGNWIEYDDKGLLLWHITPDEVYAEYLYDDNENMIEIYKYLTDGCIEITSADGVLLYSYDPALIGHGIKYDTSGISVTNSRGDKIYYQDGAISGITLAGTDIVLSDIEPDGSGGIKNAVMKYPDGALGVIYNGKMLQIILADGTVKRFREGSLVSEYHRASGITVFEYIRDLFGNILFIRITNGETVCTYDQYGTPIKFIKADKSITEFENGYLKRFISADGEEYRYELKKDQDMTISELVSQEGLEVDENIPFKVYYGENKRITKVLNSKGENAIYENDLIRSVYGGSNSTEYDYLFNETGNLQKVEVARSGITRIYNNMGELESLHLDDETSIIYENGGLKEIERSDGTKIREITFSESGDISNAVISAPDGSMTLYNDGEILRTINNKGDIVEYSDGKIEQMTLNDGSVYDWFYEDGMVKINDHNKNEYRWYLEGRLKKVRELTGAEITIGYDYDAEGRLSETKMYADEDVLYLYTYSYEADLTLVHDEDGNVQAYDKNKKLIYLIDPKKRKYTYTYVNEGTGFMEILMPDLSEVKYDNAGNIIEITRPDGIIVKEITFSDDNTPQDLKYVHEGTAYIVGPGKIKETIASDGTLTKYDAAGFVESVISPQGVIETYEYVIEDEHFISGKDLAGAFSFNGVDIKDSSVFLEEPFDYGTGSDGDLIVSSGETVLIDGAKEYSSIYVAEGGILSVNGWDGTKGGEIILNCTGLVRIDGIIEAAGKGYGGGVNNPSTGRNYGANPAGESYTGLGSEGPTPNYGGGGGASDGQSYQPDAPGGGGGGGGSYGTEGANGSPERYRGRGLQGYSGDTYGAKEPDKLYLGSGGGAGGDHSLMRNSGGNGGAGGGAIYIAAPEIIINGTISANGGNGTNGGDGAGGGGGGSGGTVWLRGKEINITGTNAIMVKGGAQGNGSSTGGDGGEGGYGRVRIDYVEFEGDLPDIPTLYAAEKDVTLQGELISDIIETDADTYEALYWSEELSEGTDIVFYTRTGDTPEPDQAWSAWSGPLTDPAGSAITSSGNKYIQYKAVLSTTNKLISPKIFFGGTNGINVTYKRTPQDTSDIDNIFSITASSGGDISVYDNNVDALPFVFNYTRLNKIISDIAGCILNETQRLVYLRDNVVISELKEIEDMEGTVTTYVQGEIAKIQFAEGGFIDNIILNEDGVEIFDHTSAGETYTLRNGAIEKILTSGGTGFEYDELGFVRSITQDDGRINTYEYIIEEAYSEVSLNGLLVQDETLIKKDTCAFLETPFDYGTGSDGDLIVSSGETIFIDGVKQYSSIYVAEGGVLSVYGWDGATGGEMILNCTGQVKIDGIIEAAGKGFRGGANNPSNSRNYGANGSGESYTGIGGETSSPNFGGGGGAYDGQNHQPDAPSGGGGGGGSYGTKGTNGSPEKYRGYNLQGYAGYTYGQDELDEMYMGSGGGAGGDHSLMHTSGGNGGNGGGVIYISAPEIIINGKISASGEPGENAHGDGSGGGGGGSGGTIWLRGAEIEISEKGNITAEGGARGIGASPGGNGGNGGYGRVRIDYVYLEGDLPDIPTLYTGKIERKIEGELVSEAIETNASAYGTLAWSENLPEGTDIVFYTRTGDTPEPDSAWSVWSGPLTDPAGSKITSAKGKFIQYKAVLSTNDPTVSPTLITNTADNITITYASKPKDRQDIGNVDLIKVTTGKNTVTYDALGVNIDNNDDLIDLSALTLDTNIFAELVEEIPSHLLSGSQKIITVYDKASDMPVQTVAADHSVTYFDGAYVTHVKDKTGTLLVEYTYDENKNLLKTEFTEAREKLEEAYQGAIHEIAVNEDTALAELERSELEAGENIALKVRDIQAQIDSERQRLQKEKNRYDPGVYDLSEFDRVLRELDEYEIDLYAQEKEAYEDLEKQVAEARIKIAGDAEQAMLDLVENDYNVILGDIVQKESSPVTYAYYRSVLGRDPGEEELKYWLEKAKQDHVTIDPDEIIAYIKGLDEFAEREMWKENIIAEVTSFFDEYLASDDFQKETMLSSLGLTSGDVKTSGLDQENINSILTWLSGQSLHFGDSAFKTIIELFKNKETTKTFDEIGSACVKIDILTGIINKNTEGDLVISMYAMKRTAEKNGLTLYSEKIDFDELKAQYASGKDVILHINGKHYVVLKEINEEDGTVTYKDLSVGRDGQDITISRVEFMEEWKGHVLSESRIVNESDTNYKYLNASQEKNIRGAGWWEKFWKGIVSFFQKIIAPIATILLFIPGGQPIGLALLGLNAVIQTVSFVARTGSLLDMAFAVGGFLATSLMPVISETCGSIFSNIGDGIFASIKGAFTNAIPIFGSIGEVVSNISTGIGNVFSNILGAELGQAVTTYAISTAVDIGTNSIFTSIGLDPSLSNIASSLLTGLTIGSLDPDIDAVTSMLRSGTIAGVQEIGKAADLDPRITQLAAISAGALVGGLMEIDGKTHKGEDLFRDITINIASETAYIGVQEMAQVLGISPQLSYLVGIGIRSSLNATFDNNVNTTWFDGAMMGISQGVTSVAFNYAVDELDLDPLLANIGFSAIAGAIEASLSTDFQTRETGLFEKMFEIYKDNALTFLGANIKPDDYWGQAAYEANIMNFSDIIQEQGLETALNTYATSFFNSTAVNSMVKIEGSIGKYLNEKYSKGETNSVTLDNGETVEGVEVEGSETIVLFDAEGNVVGIKDPDKLVYGDLAVDTQGNMGLLNGYFTEKYGSLEIYMLIEDGRLTYSEIKDSVTEEIYYNVIPRDGGYFYYTPDAGYQNVDIIDHIYGQQYSFIDWILEDYTFTGNTIEIEEDGVVWSVSSSGDINFVIENADMASEAAQVFTTLDQEQLEQAITSIMLFGGGFGNDNSEGKLPTIMNLFISDLIADEVINSTSAFGISSYEDTDNFLGLYNNCISWTLDAVKDDYDSITNEMSAKLNDFWHSLTPEQQEGEVSYFMHSGHFRPSIEALDQNLDIGVDTLIVYEGPFIGEQVIQNENVSRVINVYGTEPAFDITDFMKVVEMGPIGAALSLLNMKDAPVPFLGPVEFTGINSKGESFNIENFNFEIIGARHSDFSYNS
ncbi:MAG: cysteine peptidase family C39 domain-containing protein, partial [Candidatus Omnitrophota bacterium]